MLSGPPKFSVVRVLPAVAGSARRLPLLLEAIRAVDRLVATWHERHLGLFAARCAGRAVHLARAAAVAATAAAVALAIVVAAAAVAITATAAATAAGLTLLAARCAARRLVGEALLRVELLLTAGKDEVHSTIPTRDRF